MVDTKMNTRISSSVSIVIFTSMFLTYCGGESAPEFQTIKTSDINPKYVFDGNIDCDTIERIYLLPERSQVNEALENLKYYEISLPTIECLEDRILIDSGSLTSEELNTQLLLMQLVVHNNPNSRSEYLPFIVKALEDNSAASRNLAAKIIGYVGDPTHIDSLKKMVIEQNIDIAITSALAIVGIGTRYGDANEHAADSIAQALETLQQSNALKYRYVKDVVDDFNFMLQPAL